MGDSIFTQTSPKTHQSFATYYTSAVMMLARNAKRLHFLHNWKIIVSDLHRLKKNFLWYVTPCERIQNQDEKVASFPYTKIKYHCAELSTPP
jgi:hypothetical protein